MSALFPPCYQLYIFESKKWNLKNDLEFPERCFCYLEIICIYDQGFHLQKMTTFWYFPLNEKNDIVKNKKQNLSPRYQKQKWKMM